MCAGFPDLFPLLFHFLAHRQLQTAALPLSGRFWSCRVANLKKREEKKAKITQENQIVHSKQIDLQYYCHTNKCHQVCTNVIKHKHRHMHTDRHIHTRLSVCTHTDTHDNLVNVIRSAEREGNRPASHLCIGNTGEIDE